VTSLVAKRLRDAREYARLSRTQFADLLEEDDAFVAALEGGVVPVDPTAIDRCARVLGLSLRRFLSQDISEAPAPLLFRSLNAESIRELHAAGAHVGLGEFLRFAEDIGELKKLRDANGIADESPLAGLDGLRSMPASDDRELFREAEQGAYEVRDRLELGDGQISSMVQLFETRLHVPIYWVTPDEIDANIDGASTRDPAAAVLVNLVGGAECWWRTRMTLAHELCHLVFDVLPDSTSGRMMMFSPHRENERRAHRPYQLPSALEQMEKRANVFAAHFMAPGRKIRALIPQNDSTSESAITLVCQHFSVGRVTAINQLTNVFNLSRQDRARMLDRSSVESLPRDHTDSNVPRGRAPRSGVLQRWVEHALMAGWIGRVRAHDYLRRTLNEPLPRSELPAAMRSAFRSEAESVRLRVQAFLGGSAQTAMWQVDEPIPDGPRWKARVFDIDTSGVRRDRGTVVMSQAHKVIPVETILDVSSES
jgi:transcriptional regulator with XRE-family HTH domain